MPSIAVRGACAYVRVIGRGPFFDTPSRRAAPLCGSAVPRPSRKAFEKYEFTNPVMDFPNLGRSRLGEENGNVLLPPLCREFSSVTVVPRYLEVTREVTEPENFCGERDALFTQIRRETEIGIIMVILPKEKLVWLNSTGWF